MAKEDSKVRPGALETSATPVVGTRATMASPSTQQLTPSLRGASWLVPSQVGLATPVTPQVQDFAQRDMQLDTTKQAERALDIHANRKDGVVT